MKLFALRSRLPLLQKELIEQAARKRTYVVRIVYAVALFLLFCLFFYGRFSQSVVSRSAAMGYGREMYEFLIVMQFAGVFVFLPAMMSGALTYEKERDSLSLLFLTRLRPWEIVLQKYFGRMVPMFTFLLLSFPILAISYAFGGVSTDYLCSGAFLLLLTCLQVGALSLMFSSFCATTSQAFIYSYVFGFLFYLGFLLVLGMLDLLGFSSWRYVDEDVVFALLPPYIFSDIRRNPFGEVVVRSIPIMVSTAFFLLMARAFLVKRAFVTRKGLFLLMFKRLDAFWHKANLITGGVILIKEPDTLPEHAPVAWREVHKRSLGKLSHLIRLLVVMEVPVMFIMYAFIVFGGIGSEAEGPSIVLFFLWALAILVLVVQSASAFVSERTNQTLDVLLATPIPGSEIVRQKARGLRRIMVVMAIPILSVVLCELWVEYSHVSSRATARAVHYLASSLLCILVYFPMFSWVALWIGMKCRARARAIIASLAVVVAWCLLPVVLIFIIADLMPYGYMYDTRVEDIFSYLGMLSPAWIIVLTEMSDGWRDVFKAYTWTPMFVNFAWHGMILVWFRWHCLRYADHYLGRIPESRGEAEAPQPERG